MSARRSPGCWRSSVAGCDRAGLGGVVKLAQRVRGWVDAVDVAIARRSRELAAEGRSESAAEVLTGYGRRSTRETKAVSDRSEVCEQMPGFEAALAAGDVSSSHVDAVANASKGLDEAGRERLGELQDALLGFARIEPVGVFERRCRLLGKRLAGDEGESELDKQKAAVSVRRWVDKPSGMHHTHLTLDPERDAKLWSAIDAQLASIKQADGNSGTPIDLLLADAVVDAVSGERVGERRVPEICVHIDYDTMLNGLHEHSVCETADGIPLPPETVRRLACEAAIVPIVLNGAGEVLELWPRAPGREPGPAAGVTGDVPHLRLPRLRRRVRPLRHPPRHRMAPPRMRPIWTICCHSVAAITIWSTKDAGGSPSTNTE